MKKERSLSASTSGGRLPTQRREFGTVLPVFIEEEDSTEEDAVEDATLGWACSVCVDGGCGGDGVGWVSCSCDVPARGDGSAIEGQNF